MITSDENFDHFEVKNITKQIQHHGGIRKCLILVYFLVSRFVITGHILLMDIAGRAYFSRKNNLIAPGNIIGLQAEHKTTHTWSGQ